MSDKLVPYPPQEIFQRLKVPSKEVLSCFLVGSRLWGTNGPKSDWDLILVVNKAPSGALKGFLSVHQGQLDALIVSKEEFNLRVASGSFLEVVCCFLCRLGSPYCLYSTASFSSSYSLSPDKLFATVAKQTERDWRMAQKYVEKGNLERGKKTIVHAFRVLLISKQIVEKDNIDDFFAASEYSDQMWEYYDVDWEFYNTKFQPVVNKLLGELKEACQKGNKK
eukprot:TRINITY_DN3407_c0_g1_i1.p1 TRINITY_DN3407_c0_g1~~TRINITY_DN3407_c0_g1_i1.p1  ORF type:complete len:222 (-),score=42.44 TRINITY_DN3407_c0_g1_i1:120-785(-)